MTIFNIIKEKNIIKTSILTWQSATNNIININSEFSDSEKKCNYCVNFIPKNSEFLNLIGNSKTVAITTYNSYKDSSTIYIDIDYTRTIINKDPKILQKISIHEMGHAMGLIHGENGTVMSPMTNTASDSITCKDLKNIFIAQNLIGDLNNQICNKN